MLLNGFAQTVNDKGRERKPLARLLLMLPHQFTGAGDVNLDQSVNDMPSPAQVARIQCEAAHGRDGLDSERLFFTHLLLSTEIHLPVLSL
jgi:hypothetical protein